MANATKVELLPALDRTTTGFGDAKDIGTLRRAAIVEASITPVTGSSPVTIVVQTRASEVAPWRQVAREVVDGALTVFGLERYVRAGWEIGAGASVYLSVTANAHVLYCEPRDVGRLAMPERAIEDSDQGKLLSACIAISEVADGYLNGGFTLPLTAWDEGLRLQTARLIAADFLRNRGTDPAGPDSVIFDAENQALKSYFIKISEGKLKPPGIVDSTPEVFEGGSVYAGPTSPRGW